MGHIGGEKAAVETQRLSASELKARGNRRVACGELELALEDYVAALAQGSACFPADEIAVLHSNCSLVLLRLGRPREAEEEASKCTRLRPEWAKGFFRRGSALEAIAATARRTDGDGGAISTDATALAAEAAECFRSAHRLSTNASERAECKRRELRASAPTAPPPAVTSPAARRMSCVPIRPQRFHPCDPALRDHLLREGFVCVGGVASAEMLSALHGCLWSHLGEAMGMVRGDPSTWGNAFAGPAHLGLNTWGGVGQSELMWRARTAPAVGAAFETAWGLTGGQPMLCSFDGCAVFRPPQLDASWRTRPALEWLHVDQGATKRGMQGLQAQLLLLDQDERSGGLVVLPRSHERHERIVPPDETHDYYGIDADDPHLDGLGEARLVCARAGDLILWDSRTVHASEPADASAPLPVDEESGGGVGLARAVCMVCMVPAEAALGARPELPQERARLVEACVTTTHWPGETSVVSHGAAFAGRMGSIGPEGRALVLGERCLARQKRRGILLSEHALASMG